MNTYLLEQNTPPYDITPAPLSWDAPPPPMTFPQISAISSTNQSTLPAQLERPLKYLWPHRLNTAPSAYICVIGTLYDFVLMKLFGRDIVFGITQLLPNKLLKIFHKWVLYHYLCNEQIVSLHSIKAPSSLLTSYKLTIQFPTQRALRTGQNPFSKKRDFIILKGVWWFFFLDDLLDMIDTLTWVKEICRKILSPSHEWTNKKTLRTGQIMFRKQ